MDDSFLEIILFAALAGFLVFRLRRELGKRTGHERRQPDSLSPSKPQDDTEAAASDYVLELPDRTEITEPESTLAAGINHIRAHDPGFDPEDFASGAGAAFEIIVSAFATGDEDALKPLLSRDVYGNFTGAIEARNRAGEHMETTVVGIKSADIIEAEMDGRDAVLTVKLVTDQINVTRNRDGKVISGDPERVVEVTDIWTFQRNTRSRDPNWSLVATRTPN